MIFGWASIGLYPVGNTPDISARSRWFHIWCAASCALFLAFLTERLVEHFVGKPLEQKAPMLDRWWLIYVALGIGGVICWFAGLSIFGELMPGMLGRILTCVLVGGGSELLHTVVSAAGDLAARWASNYR